ncbi:MAG TPA: hypothetical protein VNZ05_05185, partial [Solirubrobacteraceae bacterium]|nr:hypothetical protein [Solirubrobacteraceae bacterium]
CTKHPVKILPGGLRTIVRDRVPGGPSYAIIGERTRFLGNVEFKLNIRIASSSAGEGGSASSGSASIGPPGRKPFSWQTEEGCRPHPYTIIYGVLSQPRDVVLVRAAGKLYELRRVAIPASLRVHGVLAYAALPQEATRMIVKAPGGRTVVNEAIRMPGPPGSGFGSCASEETRQAEL